MASLIPPKSYWRVRRWVDHDLVATRRPISIFGPLFVAGFSVFGLASIGGVALPVGGVLIALPLVAWFGFVAWRAIRLVRTVSIKSAREYDTRGKFLLSTEYHRSESTLAAGRGARRKAGR